MRLPLGAWQRPPSERARPIESAWQWPPSERARPIESAWQWPPSAQQRPPGQESVPGERLPGPGNRGTDAYPATHCLAGSLTAAHLAVSGRVAVSDPAVSRRPRGPCLGRERIDERVTAGAAPRGVSRTRSERHRPACLRPWQPARPPRGSRRRDCDSDPQ